MVHLGHTWSCTPCAKRLMLRLLAAASLAAAQICPESHPHECSAPNTDSYGPCCDLSADCQCKPAEWIHDEELDGRLGAAYLRQSKKPAKFFFARCARAKFSSLAALARARHSPRVPDLHGRNRRRATKGLLSRFSFWTHLQNGSKIAPNLAITRCYGPRRSGCASRASSRYGAIWRDIERCRARVCEGNRS